MYCKASVESDTLGRRRGRESGFFLSPDLAEGLSVLDTNKPAVGETQGSVILPRNLV